MRGRLFNLPAVARALGFAVVATAIVAAALHFRTPPRRIEPPSADAPTSPDPLAEELKRCQLIADQAKDDPACEAAWAESRRRFFTYQPPSNATPPSPASTNSPGR
ncbi:MAG TPA: putative entry exclusion protein TrbK-alt [Stellaceae bacterium]|nr:putative entry exclusion protein TrbK-alt [Stellaceae bacterium]